jgi:hypothetical protein
MEVFFERHAGHLRRVGGVILRRTCKHVVERVRLRLQDDPGERDP